MKINQLSDFDWKDKIAVLRADFNVPINNNGDITDDTRIRAGIPSIRHILQEGGGVACLSHLGRPKEGYPDPNLSLKPIHSMLVKLLNDSQQSSIPVRLENLQSIEENFTEKKPTVGKVCLIENTRFNEGEKQNSIDLAKRYAALGDVFVMDAFATAHRSEASTCALAEVMPQRCAGFLLSAEIDALTKALHAPAKPFLVVVGGAKISTKLNALKHLLPLCDTLIVGGGIANHFIKAGGCSVGTSLIEPSLMEETHKLLHQYKEKIAPIKDVLVVDDNGTKRTTTPKNIKPTEKILDVGEQTQIENAYTVSNAGTIIWSGPIGIFEKKDFAAGTESLAHAIACSKAYSLVGGGDTLAAIAKFDIADYDNGISYLSTGGGAFLQFIEGTPLPAIQALMSD